MPCDVTLAQVILDFSVGGIGLRAIIALLKKLFKVQGFLASALSISCCFIATAIYLAMTGAFSLICLVIIAMAVYAGSQVTYSLTKKEKK